VLISVRVLAWASMKVGATLTNTALHALLCPLPLVGEALPPPPHLQAGQRTCGSWGTGASAGGLGPSTGVGMDPRDINHCCATGNNEYTHTLTHTHTCTSARPHARSREEGANMQMTTLPHHFKKKPVGLYRVRWTRFGLRQGGGEEFQLRFDLIGLFLQKKTTEQQPEDGSA